MNQVSWRRILQRAGSDYPGEGGGSVINMQERMPERRSPAPAPVRAPRPQGPGGDLEDELKRALDRAQRQQREARPAAPPPGWDPIFIAPEPPAARPAAQMPSRRPAPAPQAPAPTKRAGSGARNVIAISMSIAVIGLAIQQIGTQWNQSRTSTEEPEIGAEPKASAMLHSGILPGKAEQDRLGGEPEIAAPPPQETARLRSSPGRDGAPESGPEREAFFQEMEEAAKIFLSKQAKKNEGRPAVTAPASTTPVVGQATAISASEEQSMLHRGRDLIERGHVNGARMIFEHLASQQSALGAFALAQTYDARFLATLPVAGLEPDQRLAAQWYQRAAELSSRSASVR
ncbi:MULTISPECIES: hypothetical protein [Rhodomicrobium]|uniref:hypothetical protein n=1 Tax=Rhodomicrobium TaxID=1068 RepID=UPI000B4B5D8E|nr:MULTISPECIES: hypothetical protein [Rhodomicrobium]